jgi:hypothetical protein
MTKTSPLLTKTDVERFIEASLKSIDTVVKLSDTANKRLVSAEGLKYHFVMGQKKFVELKSKGLPFVRGVGKRILYDVVEVENWLVLNKLPYKTRRKLVTKDS